jgi:hypothetical protein
MINHILIKNIKNKWLLILATIICNLVFIVLFYMVLIDNEYGYMFIIIILLILAIKWHKYKNDKK